MSYEKSWDVTIGLIAVQHVGAGLQSIKQRFVDIWMVMARSLQELQLHEKRGEKLVLFRIGDWKEKQTKLYSTMNQYSLCLYL